MSAGFVDEMFATLDRFPDGAAVVHHGRTWSHAELAERAQRVAVRLQRLGLTPGDCVALPLSGRMPFVIAQLGVLLAGGVALPLNPRLPRQELLYFLKDSTRSSIWSRCRCSTDCASRRPTCATC
jgi:acyl-CoA synthetase (AMP-forming)/AMP-acid ligase II